MTSTSKKRFPTAIAVIRDGLRQRQRGSKIAERVKKLHPSFRPLEKQIRWALAHPDFVELDCLGSWEPTAQQRDELLTYLERRKARRTNA